MCEIDIRRETENERLIRTAQFNFIPAAEHGLGNQVTRCLEAMSAHMFAALWSSPSLKVCPPLSVPLALCHLF